MMRTTSLNQSDKLYQDKVKSLICGSYPPGLNIGVKLTGSATSGVDSPRKYLDRATYCEKIGISVGDNTLSVTAFEFIEENGYLEKMLLEQEFDTLTEQWKEETKMHSSIKKIVEHPAYKRIIEMGSDILPLIFKDLERAPHHWFYALMAITETNPIPEDQRGKVRIMVKYWLDWARNHGYEW